MIIIDNVNNILKDIYSVTTLI